MHCCAAWSTTEDADDVTTTEASADPLQYSKSIAAHIFSEIPEYYERPNTNIQIKVWIMIYMNQLPE